MANIRTGRKSGFVVRSGARKRDTIWFEFGLAAVTLASSATAALLYTGLNSAALLLRPFTVVRTRFRWVVRSDQSAATESFTGNVGFAVVSDQATAIGITAVPTPATDMGSDLFWLIDQWIGRVELIGTDWTSDLVDRVIDSKAMRKVDIGQDMAISAEAGIGDQGCIVRVAGRMLVKIH